LEFPFIAINVNIFGLACLSFYGFYLGGGRGGVNSDANLDFIRALYCFPPLHGRPGHILTGRNVDHRNVANLQNTSMADRHQNISLEVTAKEIQMPDSNL
jgi:hypothetical protein